jgi:KDO2-lipid IV(A) lauroyltransferase
VRSAQRGEPPLKRLKRTSWWNRLEYGLFRVLAAVFVRVPLAVSYPFARGLSRVLWLVLGRHRRLGVENAMRALGVSRREAGRIVRRSFEHMGMLALETMVLPRRVHAESVDQVLQAPDWDGARRAVAAGRGVIFVTGHVGNWEVLGASLALKGLPLHSVAKPLRNPLINDYLVRVRECRGQRIISKRGAVGELVQVLGRKGYLGMVADQYAKRRGILVEFFGRPASTHASVALLSVRMNVPVVPGFAFRVGNGFRFEAKSGEPIWPDVNADRDQEVRRITQEFSRQLERFVRSVPDQYLWAHDRWKLPRRKSAAPAVEGATLG